MVPEAEMTCIVQIGGISGEIRTKKSMTCIVQILILMWCFLIEEIFERIVFLTN